MGRRVRGGETVTPRVASKLASVTGVSSCSSISSQSDGQTQRDLALGRRCAMSLTVSGVAAILAHNHKGLHIVLCSRMGAAR